MIVQFIFINYERCKMDIFDLNLKEFEEKVNELVENMTADELLEELIDN